MSNHEPPPEPPTPKPTTTKPPTKMEIIAQLRVELLETQGARAEMSGLVVALGARVENLDGRLSELQKEIRRVMATMVATQRKDIILKP